jgi:DNA-binding IclR family transcriptional regulator
MKDSDTASTQDPKPAKPARYSAPALEKGLDIIELLAREERGLSQSEIARAMGRSVGEIFRMLVVLTDRGYVVQDPENDRYGLTTKLFEVAHRTPLINRLTALAGPLMRQLTSVINQSAHLAIVSDDAVLIVGQVDPPGHHVMSIRMGARIDLWRASSGRVMLAFVEKERLTELFARVPLPANQTEEQLRGELARIRERGHEITDSFTARGIVNIAAPIFDHTGHAIAALTVPHLERYDDPVSFQTCAGKVIDTANALSTALGGPSVPAYDGLSRA